MHAPRHVWNIKWKKYSKFIILLDWPFTCWIAIDLHKVQLNRILFHNNIIFVLIFFYRTSLDRIKVTIFFSSYWLTLAVMFLTGTNRTTPFAMGYVLGSFVFLWQGNEFYLRPLSYILRLWVSESFHYSSIKIC